VIWTNLTRDHLDYHGDMESYYLAKRKLFTQYESELKLVNVDDPYGRRLAGELKGEVLTYGKEGDLRILDFKTSFRGSKIRIAFRGEVYEFETPLVGEFQAYNIASAVGYALWKGIEPEAIAEGLGSVRVPGRFEVVHRGDFAVVVDYAHTPDAIENVLKSARKLARGRVIALFGAGGNRDKEKRPLMGASAERHSDLIILTSDNPREEKPEEIIRDILRGIRERGKVLIEPDRKRAIGLALSLAREGDIVMILGKGHETYQEVNGVKYPFSDALVVKEILGGDDCIGKG